MKRYLMAILILYSLVACKGITYPVYRIKNNSNKTIAFSDSNLYPDTSVVPILAYQAIDSGETSTPLGYSLSKSGIVEIFIFDNKILQANPWDSIVTKYLILRRYDLTQDSLDRMGGIITYP